MLTLRSLRAPAELSDTELLAQVVRLAARERNVTAALIAHLAELDARRLYLGEGCSSLFMYCTQVLHLSEHAAYGRIEAARAARRFPAVLDRLADGSVTLTTVTLLSSHLTPENHLDLLDRARHKTRRQVEELIANLRPAPPVAATVRRLPVPRPRSATPPLLPAAAHGGPDMPRPVPSAAAWAAGAPPAIPAETPPAEAPVPTPPARPAVVKPVAPERYRVRFTASAETHAKIRLAQDLLRHQIPDGDLAQVVDRAFTVLVDALLAQKAAATDRPRESRPHKPGSRHVPAAVRRAVRVRDGGRCAFVSPKGRRCTERGRLEFHHVRPYAEGGPATVENIQLRCRAHNAYEAAALFGPWSPSQVREPEPVYAVANRASGPARTRFKPSWTSAARPP